ncbi:MAG: hypothetical protein HY858_16140 [Candidatus Solibacter usitatus]|nr:hypothetical protein [Candidatus Solibacter usitatus]
MGNVGLLFTFLLLMGTLWLALTRITMRLENNWPLVYDIGLVVYLNSFDLILNAYVVYVAVVCALLIRFEFLNDRIVFFVKVLEICALAHIGWCLLAALLKAF